MTARDMHSPGAFDPAAYAYVGCFYLGGLEGHAWGLETLQLLSTSSYKGNFASKRSCDHCGARFAYGLAFRHANGDLIAVGETCADNAFGCESRREYDLKRLRDSVGLAREATKLGQRVKAFYEANPGLEAALCVRHHILADMQGRLAKWGDLSPKQVAFALKLADEVTKREAERAAEPKVEVVPGRRVIVGNVLSAKAQKSDYGTTYKMLVKTDDGQKLWGTVPTALIGQAMDLCAVKFPVGSGYKPYEEQHAEALKSLRGLRVSFTGTVEVAKNDPCFGFWSRPTKPEILAA